MGETAECPHCGGTGFRLSTGENGVLSSVACACVRDDRADRRLDAARIPKRYAHCTFDHFEAQDRSQEKAKEIAQDWVDSWPGVKHGLLLIGRPGTGKTHLAVAIAREVITKGAQVLFREQRELLKALQGTFDNSAYQREAEVLGPVLNTEVLLLDDLGAGRTTPWARDVMHDIIAHRYNEEKLMLITTNLAIGAEGKKPAASQDLSAPLTLRDRLGDALISRIYEMCRVVEVKNDRGDYRREIKNAQIQR